MAMKAAPKREDQYPIPTRLRDWYADCGQEIVSMDEVTPNQVGLPFPEHKVKILMNGRIPIEMDRPFWEQVRGDAERMGVTVAQFFDELFSIYTKLLQIKVEIPR